ncbi:hypothetical protein GGS26DRAFT_82786 [Hypomontagnella submonticulosa]|nr:hypothetical protein GGS26DRAFT_82786 [Hypomontagnella submonticulosa]
MNPQDAPIIEAGIYFVTEPDFAIMLLRRLVVSLVLLFATSRAATPARSITDLFQVSVDSTVGGNCAQYGTDKLQQLLNDALTLCNEAIDGMNDYINSNRGSATLLEARRLINAYFRTPPVADRPNLLSNYQRVANWITGGGPVNNGQNPNKPWLFCSDSWLIRKSMSDQAFDINGQPVQNGNGSPSSIADNPDYVAAQQRETDAQDGMQAYPYWSPVLNTYVFDVAYGPLATDGYCRDPGNKGATNHEGMFSVVTICPQSFTGVGIRSIAANPIQKSQIRRGNPPAGAQPLGNVLPEATTLFHELFHLVLGFQATLPEDGIEEYGTSEMLQIVRVDAAQNPETYAAVAVAYDYTLNAGQDSNGNRIEFFSGYATQG